jgi:hypothetical protein
MNQILENACNGKSASQGGLNVPEFKEELIRLLPTKTSEIKTAPRSKLHEICHEELLVAIPKKILKTSPLVEKIIIPKKILKTNPLVEKTIIPKKIPNKNPLVEKKKLSGPFETKEYKNEVMEYPVPEVYKVLNTPNKFITKTDMEHKSTIPLWRSPKYCEKYYNEEVPCIELSKNKKKSVVYYDASFFDDSVTYDTDETIVCNLLNKFKPDKQWLLNSRTQYWDKLPYAVKEALSNYTGDGYSSLNELTRLGMMITPKSRTALFEHYGRLMANVLTLDDFNIKIDDKIKSLYERDISRFLQMMNIKLKQDALERAYQYLVSTVNDALINALPLTNDIYVFRGISDIKHINANTIKSTSINPHTAMNFLQNGINSGIFMIFIPKGTPCIKPPSIRPEEEEIIFPLELQVLDIKCTDPESYEYYNCIKEDDKYAALLEDTKNPTRLCHGRGEIIKNYKPEKITKNRKQSSNSTLTVLTINVESYITCQLNKNCDQLISIIADTETDIICTQEDFKITHMKIPGYILVSSCVAEKRDGDFMSNNIYIRDDLVPSSHIDDITITAKCSVPRCASIITIKGVQIANLHACGGRYDDPHYKELTATKANQIEDLIKVIKFIPDLIVGDFNSEANMEYALKSLEKYPLYNNISRIDKEAFIKYFTSHYQALSKYGYKTAYDHIGPTSQFGFTVDWMYYQPSILTPIPSSVKIIPMMDNKDNVLIPNMSDHNGVLATFEINH